MQPITHHDVYQCPDCAALSRGVGDRGGNTFGATLWSDGWLEAPMLSQRGPAVLCPACRGPLWRDELQPIGALHFDDVWNGEHYEAEYPRDADPTWIAAPHFEEPEFDDLHRAADIFATARPEAERVTRIWIWWRENDAYRDPAVSWVPLQQREARSVTSTQRLKALLKRERGDLRLMVAELQRESQDFEESIRVLSGKFRAGPIRETASKLGRLAEDHVSRVIPLPSPERRRR